MYPHIRNCEWTSRIRRSVKDCIGLVSKIISIDSGWKSIGLCLYSECVETCPDGAVINAVDNFCYWDSGSSQGSYTEAIEQCKAGGLTSTATLLNMKTTTIQELVQSLTLYDYFLCRSIYVTITFLINFTINQHALLDCWPNFIDYKGCNPWKILVLRFTRIIRSKTFNRSILLFPYVNLKKECFLTSHEDHFWIGLRRYRTFVWSKSPNTQITYTMWKDEDDGSRTESNLDEGDCIVAEEDKDHKWKDQSCNSDKMFICQLEKEHTSGMFEPFC